MSIYRDVVICIFTFGGIRCDNFDEILTCGKIVESNIDILF